VAAGGNGFALVATEELARESTDEMSRYSRTTGKFARSCTAKNAPKEPHYTLRFWRLDPPSDD
jgi:hypothetical protein